MSGIAVRRSHGVPVTSQTLTAALAMLGDAVAQVADARRQQIDEHGSDRILAGSPQLSAMEEDREAGERLARLFRESATREDVRSADLIHATARADARGGGAENKDYHGN